MSTIPFPKLLTKLAAHDKNRAIFLMKDYQTISQRNPTAYKSSRIFIYLIFQKICLLTAFLLSSQAAHFPEKDLVRQNLDKP